VKSFLLSWLARKYAGCDLATFARERPEHWLVWEAGPWRPPHPARDTVLAGSGAHAWSAGESLAIALEPRHAGEPEVKLGRGPDNDLVVDDATLSRSHLALARGADGAWTVRDLGSSNGTRLGGRPVGPAPVRLEPGAQLEAGAVRLTFYDSAGLRLRLRGAG
jgi:hypothetical protein